MSDISTINLLETDNAVETVINIIKKLKEEHSTICPNDIAVVFTGDKKDNYLFAYYTTNIFELESCKRL